jgi:hypothetical protein
MKSIKRADGTVEQFEGPMSDESRDTNMAVRL